MPCSWEEQRKATFKFLVYSLLYEQMSVHKVTDCLNNFELHLELVCESCLKLLIKLRDFLLIISFELVKRISICW
jgi:hypothetical protein